MFSHAKTAVLILAAATQLAVAGVTSLSPKVIDLSASELQRRAACSSPGVVNGQCGRYYRNGGCDNQIGQIAPDCSGTCYRNSEGIISIKATGDGTYGTNCVLYEDDSCQRELGQTGNTIFSWNQKCYTAPDGRVAHSFICWFKC